MRARDPSPAGHAQTASATSAAGGLMTVGELSRRTGLTIKAIRRYEASGLIYSAGRSDAGYRLFDDSALWCAQVIVRLRSLGLTIRELEQLAGLYRSRPGEAIGPYRRAPGPGRAAHRRAPRRAGHDPPADRTRPRAAVPGRWRRRPLVVSRVARRCARSRRAAGTDRPARTRVAPPGRRAASLHGAARARAQLRPDRRARRNPYTTEAATLFYATTMLVAAWRGQPGCELTLVSNWILRRDDQVGCPIFWPIDALEARHPIGRAAAAHE